MNLCVEKKNFYQVPFKTTSYIPITNFCFQLNFTLTKYKLYNHGVWTILRPSLWYLIMYCLIWTNYFILVEFNIWCKLQSISVLLISLHWKIEKLSKMKQKYPTKDDTTLRCLTTLMISRARLLFMSMVLNFNFLTYNSKYRQVFHK